MDTSTTVTVGLKESEDVVGFIEKLADSIIKAKSDNTIDWKDVQYTPPLILQARLAIQDGQKILGELKGANGEQLEAITIRFVTATLLLLDSVLR